MTENRMLGNHGCYIQLYVIKRSVLNCVLSVAVNEAHLRQSLKYNVLMTERPDL